MERSGTPRTMSRELAKALVVTNAGIAGAIALRPELAAARIQIHSLAACPDISEARSRDAVTTDLPFRASRRLTLDRDFIMKVRAEVDRLQPDVVHIEASRRVLTHAMLALRACPDVPVLVTRGAIGGLNVANPGDWLCYFARRRQRVICISEAMAAHYRRAPLLARLLPAERLEVLHLHVPDGAGGMLSREAARAELGVPPDAMIVGSICTIRPIKGLPLLARALAAVADRGRDVRLLVIGSGADRAEVERLKAAAGSLPLHLPGPRHSARRYLAAMDVFASPTGPPGEGFGIAIVEAMLAARPVIVSQVGAAPELVGSTGLVAAQDERAWQAGLLRLIQDHELRVSLGREARERAGRLFGRDAIAARLAQIYRRAIADLR